MKHCPLILLLLAPTALASYPLTGFYVKAGLGGTTAEYDATEALNLVTTPVAAYDLSQSVDHQLRGTNWAGLLGMGYSYQLTELWIISAEFTAGYTSANASFKNDVTASGQPALSSEVSMTMTNDFALIAKPGLAIYKQTQFYALLGTRWGNFQNMSRSSTEFFNLSFGGSGQSQNYVLGFTVGLGVERLFTKHWGLALEYAYTSFGNIPSSTVLASQVLPPPETAEINEKAKASASTSNLLLDVTYRF